MLGKPLEYFNAKERRGADGDPAYPDDPKAQIERILVSGATPNGVYAVKLFSYQQDEIAKRIAWTQVLPNLRFVYLERRDLLGQAIAVARAIEERRRSPTYSADGIRRAMRMSLRERTRWAIFFAYNGIDPLYVIFEDFTAAPHSAANRVAALVDIKTPAIAERVGLPTEGDEVVEEWRRRYVGEHGNPDFVDVIGSNG